MNSEEHVVAPSASHVFENATKHIDKLKKDLEDLVGAINSIRDSCEYVLRRFVRVKLVIFKMPSEYSHGKVLQEKGTGDIVELRILNKEISSKLRTLRKELNKILHIEGYRVSDLWVLRHNADINRVEKFIEKAHGELTQLGFRVEKPFIVLVDAFLPREFLLDGLNWYITERKRLFEIYKVRLNTITKIKEKKRMHKRLQLLQRGLRLLEEELKYLEQTSEF